VTLRHLRSFLTLSLIGNLCLLQAAGPVIGTVSAKGSFRVNQASVANNATLFEGAVVETGSSGGSMALSNGARFSLASESRGQFFGDHVVLDRGEGHWDKTLAFRVEARGLTIQPESGNATGRVSLSGSKRIQVAALTGSFRVLNARGTLVARLRPGLTLAFEPQAGGSGLVRVTGTLLNRGGHYLLTDETTNVVVEVAGPGLEKEVGRRVELTGTTDPTATPVSDASQFIRITSAKRLPGPGAAPAGSGGPSGGGASGIAISTGTIAVIGGVAAAAVVGGLAASGGLTSDNGLSR